MVDIRAPEIQTARPVPTQRGPAHTEIILDTAVVIQKAGGINDIQRVELRKLGQDPEVENALLNRFSRVCEAEDVGRIWDTINLYDTLGVAVPPELQPVFPILREKCQVELQARAARKTRQQHQMGLQVVGENRRLGDRVTKLTTEGSTKDTKIERLEAENQRLTKVLESARTPEQVEALVRQWREALTQRDQILKDRALKIGMLEALLARKNGSTTRDEATIILEMMALAPDKRDALISILKKFTAESHPDTQGSAETFRKLHSLLTELRNLRK